MRDLLSRKSYRQVVKNLAHYRKQHEEDRRDNPSSIPPSWGMVLVPMIERTVRENHERVQKGQAELVLEYLVTKGLLVHYAGDFTFPTGERLPTKSEIVARVEGVVDAS